MTELDVAELYEAHVDFVWRLLARLGVPESSAEDAVQEVFLVLHRRRGDFREHSSVRTWIGGVVVRVARDWRRGLARQQRNLARIEAPTNQPHDPHERVSDVQSLALALELLESLDADQRVVFVLAELEELSTLEIAEITGAKPNTVSSRLRLARQHFNELIVAYQRKEGAL